MGGRGGLVGGERLQTANKRPNAKLKFNHRPTRLGLGPTVVWPFCNVYQVQARGFSSDRPLLNGKGCARRPYTPLLAPPTRHGSRLPCNCFMEMGAGLTGCLPGEDGG